MDGGRMNARDTLRALADGETIIDKDGFLWKVDEYDELVVKKLERERWIHSYSIFNGDCEIYKEYPLDFEQALRAMLDGKVVRSDLRPHLKQRFHDRRFEFNEDDDEWLDSYVPLEEQKAKWKVVE